VLLLSIGEYSISFFFVGEPILQDFEELVFLHQLKQVHFVIWVPKPRQFSHQSFNLEIRQLVVRLWVLKNLKLALAPREPAFHDFLQFLEE